MSAYRTAVTLQANLRLWGSYLVGGGGGCQSCHSSFCPLGRLLQSAAVKPLKLTDASYEPKDTPGSANVVHMTDCRNDSAYRTPYAKVHNTRLHVSSLSSFQNVFFFFLLHSQTRTFCALQHSAYHSTVYDSHEHL
jgi:hypothetical protein